MPLDGPLSSHTPVGQVWGGGGLALLVYLVASFLSALLFVSVLSFTCTLCVVIGGS